MFRVFKVTSPMNIGTWLLGASGTATAVASAAHLAGMGRLRNAAERVSALCGLPLGTYTAVLVSDTAVPVWHEARRELPFVFASSSAASGGAAAAVFTPATDAGPARRIAVGGAVVANVATLVMEKRLGGLAQPYKEGAAGRYNKLAKGLSLTGAAILGVAGRRRAFAVAGGALLLAGEACLRWSVFRAGFQSAEDPRFTVEPQRERADRDGSYASTKTRPS
jgi:hypothetical protein